MSDQEITTLERAVAENQLHALTRLVDAYERQGELDKLLDLHRRTDFALFKLQPVADRGRERLVQEIQLGRPRLDGDEINVDVIKVRISYSEGGANYFNGETDPRCYALVVTWVTRQVNAAGHGRGESFFVGTNGHKKMLEPAKRFSAQRLAKIEAPAAVVADMVKKVRAKWETQHDPASVPLKQAVAGLEGSGKTEAAFAVACGFSA